MASPGAGASIAPMGTGHPTFSIIPNPEISFKSTRCWRALSNQLCSSVTGFAVLPSVVADLLHGESVDMAELL
jgi:hypothetical protein